MTDGPPWENVAAVFALRASAGALDTPKVRAWIDQCEATLRDGFDRVGLATTDPWVIYTAMIATQGIINQLAVLALTDAVPVPAAAVMTGVLRGNLVMLAEMAPAEAAR